MPRVVGVDIPEDKPIKISLTYLFGIGHSTARKILSDANVDGNTRAKKLTEDEMSRIRREIESKYRVEGDRRREVSSNIKLKMDIACYQGLRHRKGLPVRGQRTNTNARTRKGPPKTIAGKKKAPTSK